MKGYIFPRLSLQKLRVSKAQRDPTGPNKPPEPSPYLLSPAHLCFSYFIKSQFPSLLLSGYFLPHSPLYFLWNALIHKTSSTFVYCLRSLSLLLISASALKSILLSWTCKTFHHLTPMFVYSYSNLCSYRLCALSSSGIYSHWVSSGFLPPSPLHVISSVFCFSFLETEALICTLMESYYQFVS